VQWIQSDLHGVVQCSHVPHIKAIWAYLVVLPLLWCVEIHYARLLINGGAQKVIAQIEEVAPQQSGWLDQVYDHLNHKCSRMLHTLMPVGLQVLGLIYGCFRQRTLKWQIGKQLLWFSVTPMTFLIVMPALRFYVALTQFSIGTFILEMFARRRQPSPDEEDNHRTPSCDETPLEWSSFLEKHRRLESSISEMWLKLGMAPWIPGFLFLVIAIDHFASHDDPIQAFVGFGAIAIFGGILLCEVLSSIANISSMFGSLLAYRGAFRPFTGKMSIAAVVRRFGKEDRRTDRDQQDYQAFLEYVHGFHYAIVLPIKFCNKRVMEIPITKVFVTTLFTTTVAKFPVLLCILFFFQKRWEKN
jgi:hypothetical protein